MAFKSDADAFAVLGNIDAIGSVKGVTLAKKGDIAKIQTNAIADWAKDPKVRIMVKIGILTVVVYGESLSISDGEAWLSSIARGELQF